MRAYSCARITLFIVALTAVCVSSVAIDPDQALAREPEYKMVTVGQGGGTSGGGEWKTDPNQTGQLPMDGRTGGNPGQPGYSNAPVSASDLSWVKKVETAVIRVVRFVGATYSQLY